MYYYFNLNGGIVSMPEETAEQLMPRIAPELKKIDTAYGKLYCGEYDWRGEVVDGEYKTFPPYLKDGTVVRPNKLVQRIFNRQIHGECFLFADKDKRGDIFSLVTELGIGYSLMK